MPCCKAERYKWCKDQQIVFKDEEGKEYCVFHAPKGGKGISLEEFNRRIFVEINQAKKENTTCNLSGTVFEGDIRFNQFDKNNSLHHLNFFDAIFEGEAVFSDSFFNGITAFSNVKFNGRAYFSYAVFAGQETSFSGAKFKEIALFVGTKFNSFATFKSIEIEKRISFEGANLIKVSFLDTDLRKIDFINCDWPKKPSRFEWLEKFSRDVLYDELNLFYHDKHNDTAEPSNEKKAFWSRLKHRLKQKLTGFKKDISFDKERIKKVEILYRQLKQKYKEEHNEPEVSNWHYGEKEMYRKGSRFRRFFPFSISNLYWLSSGYGERPFRSGIVLSLLIIVISVLFGLTGLKTINSESVIEIKEWADIWKFEYLKATIEYATFESKPDFIPANWFLKISAKLLIPLQAALFALAVRNKFRR